MNCGAKVPVASEICLEDPDRGRPLEFQYSIGLCDNDEFRPWDILSAPLLDVGNAIDFGRGLGDGDLG